MAPHAPDSLLGRACIEDSTFRLILTALFVYAAYCFGALFSFSLRVPSTRSSIIWAPNAILLATLLATPARTWWIWLIAALPAHLIAQARDEAPLLLLLCPFLANAAQVLIAALALRRFMNIPDRLETFRDMAVFALFTTTKTTDNGWDCRS